jgi:hypothetical protein
LVLGAESGRQNACVTIFQQSQILSCVRDTISVRNDIGGGGLLWCQVTTRQWSP